MKIGYIGLGRMGRNMVLHLLEKGIEVVVWNRSPEPKEQLKQEAGQLKSGSENLTATSSLDELIGSLESPRVIWLMVTAGPAIDELLTQLAVKNTGITGREKRLPYFLYGKSITYVGD